MRGVHQTSEHEVIRLLAQWSNGDKSAFDKLMPLIHDELRRLAHRYMRRERPGHTLQTTALVNETYLRLTNRGCKRSRRLVDELGVLEVNAG